MSEITKESRADRAIACHNKGYNCAQSVFTLQVQTNGEVRNLKTMEVSSLSMKSLKK